MIEGREPRNTIHSAVRGARGGGVGLAALTAADDAAGAMVKAYKRT